MGDDITLLYPRIVLDACCLINLFASEIPREIIESLPAKPVVVVRKVSDDEALTIRGAADDIEEPLDLLPLVAAELITIVDFDDDEEIERFIALAVSLDDGEAASAAVAIQRNWAIATDDGKARKFLTREAKGIQLLDTPELIRHWVSSTSAPPDKIRMCIRAIKARGRYELPRSIPSMAGGRNSSERVG